MPQDPNQPVALDVNELIERFNFEMRVIVEFTRLLVPIPGQYDTQLMTAVFSIQEGILSLVNYAGLKEAPNVAEYMSKKIWGTDSDPGTERES